MSLCDLRLLFFLLQNRLRNFYIIIIENSSGKQRKMKFLKEIIVLKVIAWISLTPFLKFFASIIALNLSPMVSHVFISPPSFHDITFAIKILILHWKRVRVSGKERERERKALLPSCWHYLTTVTWQKKKLLLVRLLERKTNNSENYQLDSHSHTHIHTFSPISRQIWIVQ